ncbi:hypothetical protein [Micromonospora sp. NPDC000442]|uniref:hypothetical protein n=1 Tax=Micromonospora sp. NPDC000442 TaxID=3364217 RepID=UPI0036972977
MLRIDQSTLLGRDRQRSAVDVRTEGVERIRAALSTYDMTLGRRAAAREAPSAAHVARSIGHAWTTYQHARYPQLISGLPELVVGAQCCYTLDPGAGRVALVEAYRITAALLVKLGEAELGWLAVDRAMTIATDDAELVASAAVQLGQVLRATGRSGSAVAAMRTAAYRIVRADLDGGQATQLSLCGTLLVQAALAAARQGDERATASLLDEAADLAARVGDGHDHHHTAFGPTQMSRHPDAPMPIIQLATTLGVS